jgi:type 1 fimbriae regulatory protein FimB/type 1 fimbriae regulatory protein FimE
MVEAQASETKSGTVRSPRSREHLTEAEIERLMTVARHGGRYGHRNATAILVAFRHGLRPSELVDLQWDQIDFVHKTIRLNRVKNGTGSTHYLSNSELRALRRLQRDNPPWPHVFVSERGGGPVTTAWFRKMMARLGERARMPFLIHPHMLRHSCGFKYANEGKDTRSLQAYMGRDHQRGVRLCAELLFICGFRPSTRRPPTRIASFARLPLAWAARSSRSIATTASAVPRGGMAARHSMPCARPRHAVSLMS